MQTMEAETGATLPNATLPNATLPGATLPGATLPGGRLPERLDHRSVPGVAWLLGFAGLIPFLATGLLAVNADPLVAARGLLALTDYGAVILAFLGGVHWGTALAEPVGYPAPQTAGAQRARLALGVVPSLVGWVALLLALALPLGFANWAGLVLLIAGFAGTTTVESRATRRGLLPRRYMLLRWILSAVVVIVLVGVLLLRLLGAHLSW